ncbi:hypothetical protein CJ030_MR1G013846 [Morella rubra]|uniref:Uncharacterized protein n=1 Tax=Morella rubra TaxID=262757 RepID=A0A6A1WT96_9ROSI|nr:hypothetical protein CJ030_MR1G013846 [Morella rubra]
MMKTARKKTEWFPTTGDRVLRSIPRSDYFPGQPWATADYLLGPDVYEGEWSSIDWTRAENFLRITGAAYVKHHFDGRGNISHSAWKGFFREAGLRREGFGGNGVPRSLSRSLVFRRVDTSESAASSLKVVIDQYPASIGKLSFHIGT